MPSNRSIRMIREIILSNIRLNIVGGLPTRQDVLRSYSFRAQEVSLPTGLYRPVKKLEYPLRSRGNVSRVRGRTDLAIV